MDDDGGRWRSRAASVVHSIIVSNTRLWWTLDSLAYQTQSFHSVHMCCSKFTTLEEKTIAGAEAIMLRIWIILDDGKEGFTFWRRLRRRTRLASRKYFYGHKREAIVGRKPRWVSTARRLPIAPLFPCHSLTAHTPPARKQSRASGPHEI